MCGRAVCALAPEELMNTANANKIFGDIEYTKSYNITPGKYLPVFYKHLNGNDNKNKENKKGGAGKDTKRDDDKYNTLELIQWGTKNSDNKFLINARSENVNIFPIFKACKRCVVIIEGYFEWQYTKEGKDLEAPRPFYTKYKSKQPMLLAGLYNINNESVNNNFINIDR